MATGSGNRQGRAKLPEARLVNRGTHVPNVRNLGIRRLEKAIGRTFSQSFGKIVRPLKPFAREFGVYFFGFFPLFAAIGLALAFLWVAAVSGSP